MTHKVRKDFLYTWGNMYIYKIKDLKNKSLRNRQPIRKERTDIQEDIQTANKHTKRHSTSLVRKCN